MLRSLCLFVVLLTALCFAPPASCQSSDFVAALSGDKHPLTMKLKDLDGSWRSIHADVSGEATSQMEVYVALMSRGGGTQNTFYTTGEMLTVGGELYLIAYHHARSIDYAALMRNASNPPMPLKLTPETTVSLCLLNLHSLGSLRDVQPFSLAEALKSPPATGELSADATPEEPDQASVTNLKQIGVAFIEYTQDFDEVLPPMKTVAQANAAISPLLKTRFLFEHPGTHELYQVNTSLSHRTLASFKEPGTMVIYYEASPGGDGLRAVLFLDGHVKRIPKAEW